MNKYKVTFGQVHRLLHKYGYERISVEGKHVLFEQKSAGAVLVLRPHRSNELIDPVTLAAVRLNMDGNGILERDRFEDALEAVSANGKIGAKRG